MLLTIGIPTYNRHSYLKQRLLELDKKKYFNDQDVQIIIHDNDSTNKSHILEIKKLQNYVKNLFLIQSTPNCGMVVGCRKIISASTSAWIVLLGDDDPILMSATELKKLLSKSKSANIFFRFSQCRSSKIAELDWFPKINNKVYKTSSLVARTGFTTLFAFIGAHCFRNNKQLLKQWRLSHQRCMFYGHCVMFLEYYQKSSFTGVPLVAWNPGNERISHEMNVRRLMELKVLLSNPRGSALHRFLKLKPQEIVEKGNLPLVKHIYHPYLCFLNRLETLPVCFRIRTQKVENLLFSPDHPVHIGDCTSLKNGTYAAALFKRQKNKNTSSTKPHDVWQEFLKCKKIKSTKKGFSISCRCK